MAQKYLCDRCGADMTPLQGATFGDDIVLTGYEHDPWYSEQTATLFITVKIAAHRSSEASDPDLCTLCRIDAVHLLTGKILDRRQAERDAKDAEDAGAAGTDGPEDNPDEGL